MMDDLAENMKESRTANETIVSSAQNTSEDCMKSLSHVSSMHDIVAEMVQASASIFLGLWNQYAQRNPVGMLVFLLLGTGLFVGFAEYKTY